MSLGEDLDQIGFEQDDWSFEGCRRRLRKATAIVLDAEAHYEKQARRSAEAESVYRLEVGKAFAGYRKDGEAVEAAKIAAHRDCVKLSHERDFAKDLVRLAADKLDNARDSRRSVWRLVEWARDRDLATARSGGDEREPAGQWP